MTAFKRRRSSGLHLITVRATALLWFTVAAILFGSLAPSWAQIIVRASAEQSLSYVEVCTAGGLRQVTTEGIEGEPDSAPPSPATAIDAVHCGFCLTQHQLPGLVPPAHRLDGHLAKGVTLANAGSPPAHIVDSRWRPPPRAPPSQA